MDRALYDPLDGFYARHGMAGRSQGDFITSPEVGPLFGKLIGRYLDAEWHRLGCPPDFEVVEVGAGRGALARSILASEMECRGVLRYRTVERSERLRQIQHHDLVGRVEISSELPETVVGVVIANELLDNLATRVIQSGDRGWQEWFVEDGAKSLRPFDLDSCQVASLPALLKSDRDWQGVTLPIHEQASQWVSDVRGRVRRGSLVAIDYGAVSTLELAQRDWLRCYRQHQEFFDPFSVPVGACDVTVDIGFDQLDGVSSLTTQAEWLRGLGIDELVEQGRRIWSERAHLGDLAALKARSRISEAESLTDPDGLGGFWVARWSVEEPSP